MSNHPSEPLLEIEDVLPILNRIAVFGGLSDTQLYEVFRVLEKAHFHRGEFIFEKGDAPSHIYIVWKGRVELLLEVKGSYFAEMAFSVGDSFGETSVIGILPHTAGAMAVEDTQLIVLSKEALFSFRKSDPSLFTMLVLNIAREACRRLNRADETLLHYFADHR